MNRIAIANKMIKLAEDLIKQAKFYDADKRTEYFVNPTLQELDSISSGIVRFIADNDTKQVYCWDGDVVMHYNASRFLGIVYDDVWKPKRLRYLIGDAVKVGGGYVLTYSNILDSLIHKEKFGKVTLVEILNTDWSWVNQYINVTDYLNKLKR